MTTYYSKNPKFYVSVDCIIFGFNEGELNLLLLKLQQMNDDNRFRLPDMPDRNFLGVISDDAGHL